MLLKKKKKNTNNVLTKVTCEKVLLKKCVGLGVFYGVKN